MILKRELYELLPWWAWVRLRLQLQWGRMGGGWARALGVRGREDWGGSVQIAPRAVPVPGPTVKREEMIAATLICPTEAFETDAQNQRTLLHRPKCVLCGLCYRVAHESLAPSDESGQSCLPGVDEITEFWW